MIFHTDPSNFKETFSVPDSSHRIMGITEEKELHLFLLYLTFKISKIHFIMTILLLYQCVTDKLPAIVFDHTAEGIIDRLLDHDSLSLFCEGSHCHSKGKYYPRCLDQPLFFYLPSMLLFHPVPDRCKIILFGITVAIDPVSSLGSQGILDIGAYPEVHICHPQRQYIRWHSSFYGKIIFQAVSALTFYRCIKIKISFTHSLFLPFTLMQL